MIRKSKSHIIVFSLFLILFTFFIIISEQRFRANTINDLKNQSETVSINLWQFDVEACKLNLDFFSDLNNYLSICVTDYTGAEFSRSDSLILNSIDSKLLKIGLLRKSKFTENIIHEERIIGVVSVEKLNRKFYTYLYIFILLVLIAAVYVAVSSLRQTNSRLNELVEEKTRQLRSSEEELRITLNSIGEGVLAADLNNVILHINPSAEKILNVNSEKFLGKKLQKAITLNTKDKRNPLLSLKTSEVTDEISMIGTIIVSEHIRTLDINVSPILGDGGERIGAVYVFSDITEKLELEERFRQSQKLKSIGQLAGGVAHDFNNMLGGIIGPAELLHPELNSDQQQIIELIIESGKSAAELTRKLLSFSRKGKVKTMPVDVNAAIQSTVSILSHSISKKIDVEMELKATDATVSGDLNELQSVFLNLGINSSHAISGEGQIIFSSQQKTFSKEMCERSEFNLKPGQYIEVAVEDNGCGIKKEDITRIFEPFFTTKGYGKGTGLGLAACYGTICEHHGAIEVSSKERHGTSFKIYLPLLEIESDTLLQETGSFTPGNGCILVVDDEPVIRSSANLMLKKMGYSVLLANDGIEAVEVFKKHRDEIDLIILDVIMPKADGKECFQILRKIDPNVKVVFASGFSRDVEGGLMLGPEHKICGFLRKPYKLSELSEMCSKAISR